MTGNARIDRLLHFVDLANEWTGKIFSFTFIPLTLITVTEVVSRYVFNRPTIWAWDINIQLFALIAIFGGGYTFLRGSHVTVDILVHGLSRKRRAIIDFFTGLICLFGIGVVAWQASSFGWESFLVKERLTSVWQPPVFPLKMMVPIGVFLLFLQALARLIRDLSAATQKDK